MTNTISPIDSKVVESQDVSSKNVENMFDEDGKEQQEGEEEEGRKRQRTAVEEVEKHIRKESKEEGSKTVGTDVREQPGASLQREDAEKDHGITRDIVAAPEFDEQGCTNIEVRRHKIGTRPTLPTKAEIAEHYPLHLNYRSWCRHCVAGKARSAAHKAKDDDEEQLGVTMHTDYAFMGGEHNEEEEGMQPSLIMYDDNKDSFWAAGVDKKGASEAMVSFAVGVFDQSGYIGEKVSFKSDQEKSIVALKHATAATRVGQTVPIESPVRASKSNGKMENAVKIWQGQLRTIKHYVEAKLGVCIEPGGALFSWLIPSAPTSLTSSVLGPTAERHMKGSPPTFVRLNR